MLTRRQAQILWMLAHGTSRKEVAHDLGITINAICAHMDEVFRRLGVNSLIEAMYVVGWVTLPDTLEQATGALVGFDPVATDGRLYSLPARM